MAVAASAGEPPGNPLRGVARPAEEVVLQGQGSPSVQVAPGAESNPFVPPPGAAAAPTAPTPGGVLTTEELLRRRQAVEAATDLDAALKEQLIKQYVRAEEWLKKAAATAGQIAAWNSEGEQAPAATAEAKEQLSQPMPAAAAQIPVKASVEELQKMLDGQQEQLAAARKELAGREAGLGARERKAELARLSEEATVQLDELRKKIAATPAAGESTPPASAQCSELEAQAVFLEQQLAAFDAEGKRLDAVGELLTLQRDLAQRRVNHQEKTVAAWQEAVAQRRRVVAEEKVQQALQVQKQDRSWQELDPALEQLGERNAKLAQQRADLAVKLEETVKEVEDKDKMFVDVRRNRQNTIDKVEAAGLSATIGLMLRDQREKLPDLAELRARLSFIETEMPKARYQSISLKEERHQIGDPDASVQRVREQLAQPLSDEAWAAIEPKVREALQRQRETLDGLLHDHDIYLDELSDLEVNTRRLVSQSEEFGNYIGERILWIRSTEPLSVKSLADAGDGLQKLATPQPWTEAFRHGVRHAVLQPARFAALVILWGGLFVLRRLFRRRLQALAKPAEDSLFHGLSSTLEAVALTIVISALWPLLVLLIGWLLTQMAIAAPRGAADVLSSLGQALMIAAYVYWPAEMARQFFRRNGLAEAHLGWDPNTAILTRQMVKRLMVVGLPLVLLIKLTDVFNEGLFRDSLGRLVFLAAMLILGLMYYREFHPRKALLESLFYVGSQDGNGRRWFSIFLAIMAILLGLVLLSIAGFHYSAYQLAARLIESLWFVLGALFVRSLIARWLFIRQWKMARRLAEERAAEASQVEEQNVVVLESEDGEEALPDTARDVKRKEEDQALVRIDQQLQKLLRLGVVSGLLIGLWMIWSGVLPALRALDHIPVWPFGDVVQQSAAVWTPETALSDASPNDAAEPSLLPAAGQELPAERTSLGDLLLTLLIAFVTIAAGRNLPGLLEVTLLDRLPLDRGARNAVTTISGYVIMLVGLLMGANTIGLHWQSVQWLAAALTVGLGFGLQEIFANFVSGLILLFERPIRVGDIITLGDVDGTVTRIRIRATTVTNADRKELIVPNKELITGRLLNWTLSDPMNRVVINVGVAYGSNIAKVRRLLLRIANDHPCVVKEPSPIVNCESFGDSTLNFVLRCFLPDLDNRLATIHDLHAAIHDRFMREGIEIAFPQMDLHLRSTPPALSLNPAKIS